MGLARRISCRQIRIFSGEERLGDPRGIYIVYL
jgi:hypothetical protein